MEDELAKDIEVQDIVTQELRNEGVEALQRGDLDACMKVDGTDCGTDSVTAANPSGYD